MQNNARLHQRFLFGTQGVVAWIGNRAAKNVRPDRGGFGAGQCVRADDINALGQERRGQLLASDQQDRGEISSTLRRLNVRWRHEPRLEQSSLRANNSGLAGA